MLSYNDCPDNLPQMPSYPTMDGVKITLTPATVPDNFRIPGDYLRQLGIFQYEKPKTIYDNPVEVEKMARSYAETKIGSVVPTLVSIGLLDALLEVEGVLAWNETEKHPDAKWKSKPIEHHDAKAVGHLAWAQHIGGPDHETGRSHRAHSIARLMMSLAKELQGERISCS